MSMKDSNLPLAARVCQAGTRHGPFLGGQMKGDRDDETPNPGSYSRHALAILNNIERFQFHLQRVADDGIVRHPGEQRNCWPGQHRCRWSDVLARHDTPRRCLSLVLEPIVCGSDGKPVVARLLKSRLLNRVRQLVRRAAPCRPPCSVDTDCRRTRCPGRPCKPALHRLGRLRRFVACVNAHAAEIVAEPRLHERPRRAAERLARFAQHLLHDRRRLVHLRPARRGALQRHLRLFRLFVRLLLLALGTLAADGVRAAGAFALQPAQRRSGQGRGFHGSGSGLAHVRKLR